MSTQNANRGTAGRHYFILAGASLMSIRKELKPALPKKREEPSYLVVVSASALAIKVAIPGAAVELPAITSGSFTVQLPYLQFKFVLTDSFKDGVLVKFEVGDGALSVNGMVPHSPAIVVRAENDGAATKDVTTPGEAPAIANLLEGFVGAPLLAAYAYLRKRGTGQAMRNAGRAGRTGGTGQAMRKR